MSHKVRLLKSRDLKQSSGKSPPASFITSDGELLLRQVQPNSAFSSSQALVRLNNRLIDTAEVMSLR